MIRFFILFPLVGVRRRENFVADFFTTLRPHRTIRRVSFTANRITSHFSRRAFIRADVSSFSKGQLFVVLLIFLWRFFKNASKFVTLGRAKSRKSRPFPRKLRKPENRRKNQSLIKHYRVIVTRRVKLTPMFNNLLPSFRVGPPNSIKK